MDDLLFVSTIARLWNKISSPDPDTVSRKGKKRNEGPFLKSRRI